MFKRYDTTQQSWIDANSAKRYDTTQQSWVDIGSAKAYDTTEQAWVEKMFKYITLAHKSLKDSSGYTILDNGAQVKLYASMYDNEDYVTFSVMGLNLHSPNVKFNFDVIYGAPRVIFDVYTGPSIHLADVYLEGISGDRSYDNTFTGNTIYGFTFTFCTSLGEGFYDSSRHECAITDFEAGGIKFKFQG